MLNENPFDVYYSIERLKITLEAPFFVELHKKIKNDYMLMERALSFEDLSVIISQYAKKYKLKTFILIKQIIEDYYSNGTIDG